MGAASRMAIVVSGSALAVAASCVSAPSTEQLVSQRIVATQYDPNVDVGSFATFAIVDVIPVYDAIDAGAPSQTLDPSIAGPILDQISSELSARGYRRVTRDQAPDLGVNVEAINRFREAQVVSYGGWWGVGTASPAYWGYPTSSLAAPFAYQTVAWQSGTLIIELYDLRDAGPPGAAPAAEAVSVAGEAGAAPLIDVVWACLVHGIVGAADAAVLGAPPTASIAQCFAQSPYLRRP
ncbi:MAG TPA: DUF4136 domain-containing protein [Polyangiaceae bacterium]|nr:DUF4136 domain-containing protein [Polyangiaceae bacterium]